jgi:hypothetical protein
MDDNLLAQTHVGYNNDRYFVKVKTALIGPKYNNYNNRGRSLNSNIICTTSAYQCPTSETVWRYIHHKTLMSKMRSLLWTIHADAYWTAAKLATFTSVSPVCPQCGQHTETIIH